MPRLPLVNEIAFDWVPVLFHAWHILLGAGLRAVRWVAEGRARGRRRRKFGSDCHLVPLGLPGARGKSMTSSPRVRSLAFLRAAEVWAVLRMWVVYLFVPGRSPWAYSSGRHKATANAETTKTDAEVISPDQPQRLRIPDRTGAPRRSSRPFLPQPQEQLCLAVVVRASAASPRSRLGGLEIVRARVAGFRGGLVPSLPPVRP